MTLSKLYLFALTALSLTVISCSGKSGDSDLWNDKWKDPLTPSAEVKPRYVWIDAAANFYYFANDASAIAAVCQQIADTGFTDIIVDVRATTGDVLYNSSVAPHMERIDAWIGSSYRWLTRTADFDYLQVFIDEGHKAGLKVNAAINTFVGGYLCPYGLGQQGMLFSDSSRKDWATVVNTSSGLVNTMDMLDDSSDYGPKFLNPANPQVQDYVLSILGELAAYDVDGIVLDRCRYSDDGLEADFSDYSREGFEEYMGQTVKSFPSDIFKPGTTDLPGTLTSTQKGWLAYRAKTIHDFIVKAADKVHSVNPDVRFGVYVGAWYSTYYTSGVNWASPKYDTSKYYKWASSDYKDYGFADHLDFMFLGCYASTTSIYGTGEWTMQGFASQGRKLLCGDVEFAGGPDIGNSTGWPDGGQGNLLYSTVDAIINEADGYFVFDLCHIRMYDYWSWYKSAFDKYLNSLE